MNGSTKIQPSHKQRQGVVYLRQSSPKQVLKNCESAINQRSLRNRLFELGWRKDQIVLIDDDQGQSGKHAAGREGFQRLVADVSLRKVGIIIGTEVSRLSRNCGLAPAAGVMRVVRHAHCRCRRHLQSTGFQR